MKHLILRIRAKPRLAADLLAATLLVNLLAFADTIYVMIVLRRYIAHGFDGTLVVLTLGALAALEEGGPHAMESVALARFFAENISVAAPGLAAIVTSGGHAVLGALPETAPA